MKVSKSGEEIWLIDALASSLMVIAVSTGEVIAQWKHRHLCCSPCFCLDEERRFFVTGDSEGILRFWPMLLADEAKEICKLCSHPSEITGPTPSFILIVDKSMAGTQMSGSVAIF